MGIIKKKDKKERTIRKEKVNPTFASLCTKEFMYKAITLLVKANAIVKIKITKPNFFIGSLFPKATGLFSMF